MWLVTTVLESTQNIFTIVRVLLDSATLQAISAQPIFNAYCWKIRWNDQSDWSSAIFYIYSLENGGAFYRFPDSGTNAVTPRRKVAEAEGLVYFWSVSPMVLGGVVLYLTAEFMHSHAVLPVSPYSCMAPPFRRPATAWTYPSTATVRTCI